MITRNRARIVAVLGTAALKDFHSQEERELAHQLLEKMEKNNESDKAAKAPKTKRKVKATVAPEPAYEEESL
jgi:hypothetical protein